MKTSTLKLSVILNKPESCHRYPASEVFFSFLTNRVTNKTIGCLEVIHVCGDKEEFVGGKRNRLDGDDAFVRETKSLLYLFSELGDVEIRLAEYFLSVLHIDFRYDGSTSTVTIRVESSRFDNICNPIS